MVVGLAPAAGKNNLMRMTREKISHLPPGIFHRFLGRRSRPMKT